MRKLILTIAIAVVSTSCIYAQTDSTLHSDSSVHQKKIDQYVGVQINELIRQVLNFSNTNNTITNPYLLTYSLHFKKPNIGIRLGVGYKYTSSTTDDGVTKTTSNLNDLSLRLGVERIYQLSKKFTTGVGIDGVFGMNNCPVHYLYYHYQL